MWPVNRWMQSVALVVCLSTGSAALAEPLTEADAAFAPTQYRSAPLSDGSRLLAQNGLPRSSQQGNYVAQPSGGREFNNNNNALPVSRPQDVSSNMARGTNPGLAIRTSTTPTDDSPEGEQGTKNRGTVASATSMITKTLGALFGVILLIVIVASVVRKQNPALLGGLPAEAVTVLGRRFVEQRQAIHLVRVGSRILILGSSAQGLSPLGEVTDPVEVDYLSGLCHVDESDGKVAKTIRSLFNRSGLASRQADETEGGSALSAGSQFAKRFREDVAAHELREHYADAMNYNTELTAETSLEELRG